MEKLLEHRIFIIEKKNSKFNEGLEALDENIKKLHKEIDRSRQTRMAGEFGIMTWIQDSNTKTHAESMNLLDEAYTAEKGEIYAKYVLATR